MPAAPAPAASVCVRSVSPRSTLPRARDPRRRTIGGAAAAPRPPSVVLPRPSSRNEVDSTMSNGASNGGVDETPHASSLDVRGGVGTDSGEPSPGGSSGGPGGGSARGAPERAGSGSGTGTGSGSMASSIHRDRDDEEDEAGDVLGQGPSNYGSSTLSRTLRLVSGCKAKRIRFYRNGDQYFEGHVYALRADRLRSLQPLLEELTRILSDSLALPHGVRHIFSLNGQLKINELGQFEDGESYVCSSSESFKPLDYSSARCPHWSVAHAKPERPHDVAQLALNASQHVVEPTDFVYPRIITVIRNGVKPRRVVRHLLNKKTARSFTQVINDLTAVVKLDSGAIKKLFALTGRVVACLADFFKEDDVFIAYGNERTSADDFFVVSEEYVRVAPCRRGRRRLPVRPRRVFPSRNESLREDRRGVELNGEAETFRLPAMLDARMSIQRLLGDGNTALVYEVKQIDSNERFALKVIGRENTIGKVELIESEIALMRRLSHPNIVQMYDCWPLDGSFYLLLELVPAGDLFDHLCEARRLSEKSAARLTRCLVTALDYLHQQRIVHRDVKPENLLLYHTSSGDLELKLADFGLATHMPSGVEENGEPLVLTTICGTPTYVAVEVIAEWGYNEKADVWSTGIILYVMLCGFPPFQSSSGNQDELFSQILSGSFGFPSPAWDHVSASAKALILHTVTVDVDERLSSNDVLHCHWISTCGEPSSEMEAMAQLEVASRVQSDDSAAELEETEREYYFSRRTSMDEISEGRRSIEFDFSRTYSP